MKVSKKWYSVVYLATAYQKNKLLRNLVDCVATAKIRVFMGTRRFFLSLYVSILRAETCLLSVVHSGDRDTFAKLAFPESQDNRPSQ